ncbi:MAG: 4-diphosphocytidyl-2C-methyl-D-erythritol synthase [Chloroflexi bacterium OLB14]|nr:MAG: 4-diphosphocytidyl-2C-methyl-D-erythritol synthase [Chloroflexi bacterium OLB14]
MISAIILAAGKSVRMRENKLLMKWGDKTVIEKVIQTIQEAGIEDIVLVTNDKLQVTSYKLQVTNYDLRFTINATNHEMLSSIKLGLQNQNVTTEATLICLGDQPQIESRSVVAVCEAYQKNKSKLVVPSYHKRRGHPWLVAKPLWNEILGMTENESPRDFLNKHADEIEYVNVDTPTILQDLDTPEDYLKYKPSV